MSTSSSTSVFSCAICLETATDPVATRCGHLFCWPCLEQWINRGSLDCPLCKSRVDPEIEGDVIPLYGTGAGSAPTSANDTHAFHHRTRRPAATNIPGRRAQEGGGGMGWRHGSVVLGAPVCFVGDLPLMLLFGLFWLCYIAVWPYISQNVVPRIREWWGRAPTEGGGGEAARKLAQGAFVIAASSLVLWLVLQLLLPSSV